MRLSDLKTGERGVIVKVKGHGGFRKRIVEMGFIKGKSVDVLLNAPLQDPVKYKIMGYEVSLRRSEADNIEVVSTEEAKMLNDIQKNEHPSYINTPTACDIPLTDKMMVDAAMRRRKCINVALVGNPNCGKTSLFNFASGAHERVGNYSGVTVDAKVGTAHFEGYEFNIVDLPGTYSLSAYSPEELYVRKQIVEHTPDIIINVIDSSNLERNLYLTTQLVDMHLRMVCALNMFDETEKRGDVVNYDKLSELFGIPMVPTVFTSGRGVDELFSAVIKLYEGTEDEEAHFRHIHINHGHEIEDGISRIQKYLKEDAAIRQRYSTRYLGIKLMERDRDVEKFIKTLPNAKEILNERDLAAERVQEEMKEDSETAIMDAKYGFIHGALSEASYATGQNKDTYQMTHLIDRIITNRYLGFPIFIAMIWLMFEITFSLGQYPMDWIETAVGWVGGVVSSYMPDGPLKAMIADGIIGGVGSVIVFLPQILILYFFISFMEDSGYMARAAFIMDKIMHKMGLHGKSPDYGLRMQRACRNGDKDHREQAQPAHNDDDTAHDELLGTTTYLYNDYRNVLCFGIQVGNNDFALYGWHRHVHNHEPYLQPVSHQGRGHPVRDGAPTLPFPNMEGHGKTHVGERKTISEENGRCHPRSQHNSLGIGLLPSRREPITTKTAGTELYRHDWQKR